MPKTLLRLSPAIVGIGMLACAAPNRAPAASEPVRPTSITVAPPVNTSVSIARVDDPSRNLKPEQLSEPECRRRFLATARRNTTVPVHAFKGSKLSIEWRLSPLPAVLFEARRSEGGKVRALTKIEEAFDGQAIPNSAASVVITDGRTRLKVPLGETTGWVDRGGNHDLDLYIEPLGRVESRLPFKLGSGFHDYDRIADFAVFREGARAWLFLVRYKEEALQAAIGDCPLHLNRRVLAEIHLPENAVFAFSPVK